MAALIEVQGLKKYFDTPKGLLILKKAKRWALLENLDVENLHWDAR